MDLAAKMRAKKARTESREFVLDDEWARQYEAAREALGAARSRARVNGDPDEGGDAPAYVKAAEKALAALERKRAENTVEVVFHAIPPFEYQALVDAHPPTAEQRADRPGVLYNPDTFQPALVAATTGLPLDLVTEILAGKGTWSPGEAAELWVYAFHVCSNVRAVPAPVPA